MPTPAYTSLATVTLGGSDSEIVFTSIPSSYRDLIVVFSGTTTAPGADSVCIRLNGDTGSNYVNVRMAGTGSSATSYADTANVIYIGVANNTAEVMNTITQIMDYSATDKNKSVLSRGNQAGGWVTAHAGRWANNSAVTSVTVRPSGGSSWVFQAGSTFSLYGIAS